MKKLVFILSAFTIPVVFVVCQLTAEQTAVVDIKNGGNQERTFSLLSINYKPTQGEMIADGTYYEASFDASKASDAKQLKDLKGKPIILHFWAPWCGPCVDEMPTFDGFAEMYGSDFHIIALSNEKKDAETVREFYKERSIKNLSLGIDENGKIAKKLGVEGFPTTIFFDSKGKELGRIVGTVEWKGKPGKMLTRYLGTK